MEVLNITLNEERNVRLTAYIQSIGGEYWGMEKRPAMIILPGGGYQYCSAREADPVAFPYLQAGYQVFILYYSVKEHSIWPNPLNDYDQAFDLIKSKADEWHIDISHTAVIGFSAGGHLAGTMGVLWKDKFIKETLNIENEKVKPNGLILCYPVITGGEFAHRGSFDNLLGKSEDHTKLSLENLVTEDTPKTFLWHTFNDGTVPVQNSLLFANALSEKRVPFEMHIYPNGVHGLSLCEESTARNREKKHIDEHVASWFNLACEWINRL